MANSDALDEFVNLWTQNYSGRELTEKLQSAGVRAGIVANGKDLIEDDAQLRFQKYWVSLDHPEIGEYVYAGVPFGLSETPGRIKWRSPLLGEHNEYVYRDVLGLTEEEIAELYVEGII
jgi:crotonobetainyl-CoA:carnitine CoA-transferase CaiB-like acyl-CoA transferase